MVCIFGIIFNSIVICLHFWGHLQFLCSLYFWGHHMKAFHMVPDKVVWNYFKICSVWKVSRQRYTIASDILNSPYELVTIWNKYHSPIKIFDVTVWTCQFCLKERVHSEMKTWERLDYCPHIQPITLIFLTSVPTFPDIVFVSKICTSMDLHSTIQGPASHHPRTCITPSVDLHQNIRGPASGHTRTCITLSRPASGHLDLHHFTITFLAS